uniref:CBM21 domain-containing protein n=1 Tax=Gongylonema pulchrum TaxID=637853 RepID=A0A183D9Z5_9BILA
LQVGATCQFCIRYVVNGTEYWDSNQGNNYALEAVEAVPTERSERRALKNPRKPLHVNNRKQRKDSGWDDCEDRNFSLLPFSMRSVVRSNHWRRPPTINSEDFLKCLPSFTSLHLCKLSKLQRARGKWSSFDLLKNKSQLETPTAPAAAALTATKVSI